MLFPTIVYGPIHSRRLGNSLGMNIMPADKKFCSFNCIYCECGWNTPIDHLQLPSRSQISDALRQTLTSMDTSTLDVITFSGNGEPTLHPDFLPIINDTIDLRNQFCPQAKVSVLSNSTQLMRQDVRQALLRCDNRILKLDAATDHTMRLIDQPKSQLSVQQIVNNLLLFKGDFTLQICFLRGTINGQPVDNTTSDELAALYRTIDQIRPRQIMIYVIDRATPCPTLEKIDNQTMQSIAAPLRSKGYEVIVCC